jgi:hypothetical protein
MLDLNASNTINSILSPILSLTLENNLLTSYDTQDKSKKGILLEEGKTLRLEGDTWKKYNYPYVITANTILDFDFRNSVVGTAAAIGFDTNATYNSSTDKLFQFQLAGVRASSSLYNTTFFSPSTDLRRVTIEVGKYLTGQVNYLTFINDHNITNPNGVSVFSNIRLYERNLSDTTAPLVSLAAPEITEKNFSYSFQVTYSDEAGIRLSSLDNNDIQITRPDGFSYRATLTTIDSNPERTQVIATYTITSNLGWGLADMNGQYEVKLLANEVTDLNGNRITETVLGGITINVINPDLSQLPIVPITFVSSKLSSYNSQDLNGTATITSAENELILSGNTWKKYQYNYSVTPETILRFEYRSDKPGDDQAIGFDRDNFYKKSEQPAFQLYGTKSLSWLYNTDFLNYSGTEWKTYEIEVGKYFTGAMQYLTFINDHDVTTPDSNSYFRNISVFDRFSPDLQAPTAQVNSLQNLAIGNINNPYIFTVVYQDNQRLDINSFDNQDLKIVGPNQFNSSVSLLSVLPNADGKSAQVSYQIDSPFIYSDDYYGHYEIVLQDHQVKDVSNNFSALSVLGDFVVNPPSKVGINLFTVANWSPALPFTDAFKSSRDWIPQSNSVWDTKEAINLDSQGWVTSLPSSGTTYNKVTAHLLIPTGGRYLGGQYIVFYDGEGTLQYAGDANLVSRDLDANQDVINVTPSRRGITLSITQTNPDDYLRNIRVVPAAQVGTYVEQIFNPDYLAKIQPFTTLRFMDWMETNNSTQMNWSTRPTVETATWMNRGVPVEIMVELANQTHSNPWFTMPHMATDDYVRSFAEYVAANLDSDLNVYVEYSNEVWNFGFGQYQWVAQQARNEWPDSPINEYQKVMDWYSRRTTQITRIWDEVFENNNPERVIGVMGARAADNSWGRRTLDYAWAENPLTNTEYGIDAVAIAPYFGNYIGQKEDQVLAWTTTEADGGLGKLFDEITQGGQITGGPTGGALRNAYDNMMAYKQIADAKGLSLISYEAGQHLVGENPAVIDLFKTANRDPRMGEIYEQYLEKWNEIGGGLMMPFNEISPYTQYGSWGALESVYDTESPKYNALLNFIQRTTGLGSI